MTLLYADGFEHYGEGIDAADLLEAEGWSMDYTSNNFRPRILDTRSRTGSHSLWVRGDEDAEGDKTDTTGFRSRVMRHLGSDEEYIGFGYALYITSLPQQNGKTCLGQAQNSSGDVQCSIWLTSVGELEFRVGGNTGIVNFTHNPGAIITKSASIIRSHSWNHIEIYFRIDSSGGGSVCRVNGVQVLSHTGVDTQPQAGRCQIIAFGSNPTNGANKIPTLFIDDLFIWNTDGVLNNTFIGDRSVIALHPSADSLPQDWLASATGANVDFITESPPDDDSGYIFALNTDDLSAFEFDNLPSGVIEVNGLCAVTRMRFSGANDVRAQAGFFSGSAGSPSGPPAVFGDGHLLTGTYANRIDVFETDPDTLAPWLPGAVDLALFVMRAVEVGGGDEARLTQAIIYAVSQVDASAFVTQAGLMALHPVQPPGRVTQSAVLVHTQEILQAWITQTAIMALTDEVPCITYWAQCWRIERLDGEVFTFTSLDSPITFRGEVYGPCDSLSASATEVAAILGEVGNFELMGLIDSDSITESDLYNGLFDGALVELWLVPWAPDGAGGAVIDTSQKEIPLRLSAGTVGNVSHRDTGFTMEALTPGGQLGQTALLQTYTPQCRWDLGDHRCTVDLDALKETGTVTAVAPKLAVVAASRRSFSDTGRNEASRYFEFGRLTWLTGANAGKVSEIKDYTLSGGAGHFTLWEHMLHEIKAGDTYEVTPGCDKSPPTCKAKFNNYVNYGGFPDVPGADSIVQWPDQK